MWNPCTSFVTNMWPWEQQECLMTKRQKEKAGIAAVIMTKIFSEKLLRSVIWSCMNVFPKRHYIVYHETGLCIIPMQQITYGANRKFTEDLSIQVANCSNSSRQFFFTFLKKSNPHSVRTLPSPIHFLGSSSSSLHKTNSCKKKEYVC